MAIRLRYAPSPTGYLHIGNTRTALMNFLYAKSKGGTFLLRIEDTDIERNVDGAIESQLDNLLWLGISPDEYFDKPQPGYGEYIQSKKLDIYLDYANKLINENKAYRCFCNSEKLEESRKIQNDKGILATKYDGGCDKLPKEQIDANLKNNVEYSIRFKVTPNKEYKTNDIVRGEITFNSNEIGDFIIIKSNKIATYNFAVVIDDFDMKITHVVRGEEHISNTPRQLMIFESFGWKPPLFCHLTLIVDENKKKLSKRSGNEMFFISQYKKLGYLPQAIFNYISFLGWSPKTNVEILSQDEIIREFDENRFSKSPSTFDVNKLNWMNNQWMKKIEDSEYLEFIKNFINKEKFNFKNDEWINEVLLLFKKEIEYGDQINNHLPIFFESLELDDEAKEILNTVDKELVVVKTFSKLISEIKDFNESNIKEAIQNCSKLSSKKGKELFMPIRIATSHSHHGPELAKVIFLLGKEKVINNMSNL